MKDVQWRHVSCLKRPRQSTSLRGSEKYFFLIKQRQVELIVLTDHPWKWQATVDPVSLPSLRQLFNGSASENHTKLPKMPFHGIRDIPCMECRETFAASKNGIHSPEVSAPWLYLSVSNMCNFLAGTAVIICQRGLQSDFSKAIIMYKTVNRMGRFHGVYDWKQLSRSEPCMHSLLIPLELSKGRHSWRSLRGFRLAIFGYYTFCVFFFAFLTFLISSTGRMDRLILMPDKLNDAKYSKDVPLWGLGGKLHSGSIFLQNSEKSRALAYRKKFPIAQTTRLETVENRLHFRKKLH